MFYHHIFYDKWSTDTAMEETDSYPILRMILRETDNCADCRVQTMWIVDFHLVVNVSLTPV